MAIQELPVKYLTSSFDPATSMSYKTAIFPLSVHFCGTYFDVCVLNATLWPRSLTFWPWRCLIY